MRQQQESTERGLGVLATERDDGSPRAQRIIINFLDQLFLPVAQLNTLTNILALGDAAMLLDPVDDVVAF